MNTTYCLLLALGTVGHTYFQVRIYRKGERTFERRFLCGLAVLAGALMAMGFALLGPEVAK